MHFSRKNHTKSALLPGSLIHVFLSLFLHPLRGKSALFPSCSKNKWYIHPSIKSALLPGKFWFSEQPWRHFLLLRIRFPGWPILYKYRLQSHLRNLARACPCPCDLDAVVGSGRELNIAELGWWWHSVLSWVFTTYHSSRQFYRVTRQVEVYMLLTSIWGVPPACGPLLQLATAQAGQGNSQNWCQWNIGLNLTCHPVDSAAQNINSGLSGLTAN